MGKVYKDYNLTEEFLKYKHDIKNFEVKDDDIWICTFPKSGTTWMQEMVWMIVNNLDFVGGQQDLNIRSPFFEYGKQVLSDFSRPEYQHFPEHMKNSIRFVKNLEGRRIIKTHLPWTLLPKDIQTATKKPKIIFIIRDPRDVVISFYYFTKLLNGNKETFEDYFKSFVGDKVLYGPYWSHIFTYWNKRHLTNILFLRYEDMKSDLDQAIRNVTNFLDIKLTNEKVALLRKHLSFESMRQNKAVNKEQMIALSKNANLTDGKGCFLRSGTCQQYKKAMSKEMIECIDQWVMKNTMNMNFPFYLES